MDVESECPPMIVRKWRHACDVFRESDPADLEPGEEEGAPADEYDFDALIASRAIPSTLTVGRAAQILAYLFSRSFDLRITSGECSAMAQRLLEGWPPDDGLDDDAFDPFRIVDECFAK